MENEKLSVLIYLEASDDFENDPCASLRAAGDGIDAGGCDMLWLSSPSGTGLEKFYKFYRDRDSQSAPVLRVKILQTMSLYPRKFMFILVVRVRE